MNLRADEFVNHHHYVNYAERPNDWRWYGDGAGSAAEENSSILSLI